MYKSTKVRLAIAIIIAFIGAISAYGFLKNSNEKVAIVVAARDIPSRTMLTDSDLKIIYVYKADYEAFFPHAVLDKNEVQGAITRIALKADEPIERSPDQLVYEEEKSLALNYKGGVDNSYFIPENKRVIGIEMDAPGALNFKLNRGDFVDLIYTSTDEAKGGIYSTVIAQHLPIFDIEAIKSEDSSTSNKQRVLLLATPDECVAITVAKRNGIIDFMLNPLNGEIDQRASVNIKEFSVEPPMTKTEMLDGLENYVDQQDISQVTKDELLQSIAEERNKRAIKETIEASNLTDQEKQNLIELLMQ